MSVDILIVDDDPHIRDVIDYALTSAGFSIRTAENGIEALQEIESKEPALVVLDVSIADAFARLLDLDRHSFCLHLGLIRVLNVL